MMNKSDCRILAVILILVLSVSVTAGSGGDVPLRCDEYDSMGFMDVNEAFCTVTGFTVTHSQNIVIKNIPPGNMVKFMKFYESSLLYMPFHLFETFPHLKTLDVSNTNILELTRNAFSAASNLTYLNLAYNNLTSIQTSVFIGANVLMRLDLSYNDITSLSVNAFCGLHTISQIFLTGNRLKELHTDIFKDNEYLEKVSLEGNLLTTIQPEVFRNMRRIKEVNLSNNQLIYIHPDTFAEAASLENLVLSYNQLRNFQLTEKNIVHQLHLDNNHLTNLTINATRFVRASHNNISELILHQSLHIETLDLSANRLTSISNITNITYMLYLDVSDNPIGPLNISTFAQLKRLRGLNLRGTGIRELKFGMFSKQKYLEELDLSFNNLTTLNLDMFVPYLTNLKKFLVDGNELTELQGNRSFSDTFPQLQKLGVSRNRFNCSYLHHLLIPPSLPESVVLNIEPDNNLEETPHIRDVSCISRSQESLNATFSAEESALESHIQRLSKQLEIVGSHSRNLELHLAFMQVFAYVLGGIVLVAGVTLITLRYLKNQRSGRYDRSSIVFHSNATMDATMTLDSDQ
ncbi:insulin-like growth factor-binding protein complex acid labile subunit [Drosophila serrata]|uniref:insulin-like growth factor-binding protein complex acid labile subunit n=1 Tax=Drosophila serrata TaxID=7274 RepID=UPI000A1D2F8A|nr:insulin-like growth factor-binding protein complex acid labile subunit [Drosophila serrata]